MFDQYRQFYGKPHDAEGARQFISARLERGDSILFLAIEGTGSRETGLGFVQLYPIFSSLQMKAAWLLNDLFVVAGARRRGVARALLDRAKRHALETRACELVLSTGVDNTPAQTLYESLGYQRDTGFYTYVLPVS
jgi:GNAT superfamily N-acetyltransferase